MARAGTAKYDVVAEDKFSRVLGKASGGFSKVQANVVTANAAMQIGKQAAAAFSGGLDLVYNSGAGVVDRQAKVAAAIQTTTEYLEAATYSAGLNGISAGEVEKGYRKMTDAIGGAADGTSTYVRALAKLDLDGEVLKLKSTEEQYALISGAMEGVGNQAERVQISRTIFGREGSFFIRNTAVQIEAARKEMDSFGISTSRIDASKVEAANDALFKIETIAGGAKKELAAGLAPAIQTVAQSILGAAKGTVEFEIASQKAGRAVISAVGYIANGYQAVDGSLKLVVLGALRMERAFYKASAAATFGETSAEYSEKVQVVTAQMEKLAEKTQAAFEFDARDNLIAEFNKNIADAISNAERLDEERRNSSKGGTFNTDEDDAKERTRINSKIEALQGQLATEEEKISQSLAKRLSLIDRYEELNAGVSVKASILRDEAETAAFDKRGELRAKETAQIEKEYQGRADKLADLEAKIAEGKGGNEAKIATIREEEEARQEVIKEYSEIALLTKQETDQLYIDSERRKVREIHGLRATDAANAAKIEKEKQSKVVGYLDKGLSAAAGKSRAAFEAQKVLDIGRALIAGKVAAVEAFKWGNAKGGLAGGLAASAASLLATGAIIQGIGGQSFGGSDTSAVTEDSGDTTTNDLDAVASTGSEANVQLSFTVINPLGGIVDQTAFDELVMDSVEREIEAKGLTGKVDANQVVLELNRERSAA